MGGVLLLVAFLTTGGLLEVDRSEGTSGVESFGWLLLVVGGGTFIYSLGRAGPEQQQACCGCTCAVAIIVLPSTGLALFAGGAPMIASVLTPVVLWVPLSWTLDCSTRTATTVFRAIKS